MPTLAGRGRNSEGVGRATRGVGCEGEGTAVGAGEPVADFLMLVGRIVVDDRVDFLALGNLRLDVVEEADELLMPMAFHVATDNGSVEDVEGGEQCRRAVA